jgi:hypothetical protein
MDFIDIVTLIFTIPTIIALMPIHLKKKMKYFFKKLNINMTSKNIHPKNSDIKFSIFTPNPNHNKDYFIIDGTLYTNNYGYDRMEIPYITFREFVAESTTNMLFDVKGLNKLFDYEMEFTFARDEIVKIMKEEILRAKRIYLARLIHYEKVMVPCLGKKGALNYKKDLKKVNDYMKQEEGRNMNMNVFQSNQYKEMRNIVDRLVKCYDKMDAFPVPE